MSTIVLKNANHHKPTSVQVVVLGNQQSLYVPHSLEQLVQVSACAYIFIFMGPRADIILPGWF